MKQGWGIMTLDAVWDIFDTGETITAIELQVREEDVFSADEIAGVIGKALGADTFIIKNWKGRMNPF